MKITLIATLAIFSLLVTSFTVQPPLDWKISDGYEIRFKGTDAEGTFERFSGNLHFDAKNVKASKFSVQVDVQSISTGNGMKNKHAKSAKWFDAQKFPFILFTTTNISQTPQGYVAEGLLEMHGVKKSVTIPFTFVNNVFVGSFSVNRLDYGIGTMEGMSKKVSNSIKIDLTVPVTKI